MVAFFVRCSLKPMWYIHGNALFVYSVGNRLYDYNAFFKSKKPTMTVGFLSNRVILLFLLFIIDDAFIRTYPIVQN